MFRFRSAYSANEIATACSKPRNDAHTNNVILNVVKNLKGSETVDGSANLEMLRFRSASRNTA